ncbi:MAG: FeoB small GTPase domain-containing protein, partial [Methanocorpusculum sp.]|nr:FeoB small GTPase domain-containing protein [Methanocorpusculum sp.]
MMRRAVLIGNPSVGKSLIFNHLTGLGVEVSNYPGTTVGLMSGLVRHNGTEFSLADLPGIYSLSGRSDEEKLVREYLVTGDADLIVAVLDAKHLERNLYLLLQASEIRKPLVIVLNMMDDARSAGKIIDADALSKKFGVPVIETIATEGKNLEKIADYVIGDELPVPGIVPRYDHHIEAAAKNLQKFHNLSEAESMFALENVSLSTLSPEVMESASVISDEIQKRHMMSPDQIIGANRHNTAKAISEEVTTISPQKKRRDLDSLLTRGFPGVPILIITMVGILGIVFLLGGFLEEGIIGLMTTYLLDPFHTLELNPFLDTVGGAVIL